MFSSRKSFAATGRSLFSLLLWLPLSALAADFYVATNGSDANAGTIDAPFATIMRAQTAAASGDTVYVRGGIYSTFTIAFTDSNYNYVHRLNKNGLHWSAYPGETPIFDFSSVPTNLRVCGFHVTGSGLTVTGFHVTGTPVGNQKQSECWRIDGSAAYVDFYDCAAYDNAANGFYWTNRSRGSATRCDAYNNIGTNGDAIGNTDGFGAHGNGVVFRYCRAWNNSDDGFDSISSIGANVYDHCWSLNHKAGGDSNGFKVGGFGNSPTTVPPNPVPVHTVIYCVAAFNGSHGFYANHQPGQSAVWTSNTSYNNASGNYNMLERYSDMSDDVAGYREVLHYNIAYTGTTIKNDNNPPENVTDNSWTKPGVVVDAADFESDDWTELTRPRSAGNNMPFVRFMHLTPGSDLAGLGAFAPPPAAPTEVVAAWTNSSRVDLTWTASPDATEYYIKRATSPGGPYTSLAVRLHDTHYTDDTVVGGTEYYYVVSSMNDISYDEGVSPEVAAVMPTVAVTGVLSDTGRSATDAITSDTTLVLIGTAPANSPVTVTRIGTGSIGTAVADGTGAWSFDYTATSLPAGTHGFQVTATDPLTGHDFTSDPFTVTILTEIPAAPTIASVALVEDALIISGTAIPHAEVTVMLDGSVNVGMALADESGAWTLSYTTPVESGVRVFTAEVVDLAGNASASSAGFAIDTRVAVPAITAAIGDAGSIGNGAITSDSSLSLVGTATPGASVNVVDLDQGIVGTVLADAGGNWSFDYTGTTLAEGFHHFAATASGDSAPSADSPTFSIFVDTIAPQVLSIERQQPAAVTITSAVSSVVFRVTFSEDVSGVNPASFILTGPVAGTVEEITAVNGSVYDVTVDALDGSGSLRLDLTAGGSGIGDVAANAPAGYTGGQSYNRVVSTTGSGTWIRSESGGLWSDPDSWQDAVIPSGAAHNANFDALDLAVTNRVILDSARTVNNLTFGDTDPSSAAGWVIDNNGVLANALTLGGPVPTITVNDLGLAATATIDARLIGSSGLTKSGPGTLVLAGANTLTGSVITAGGTLRLAAGNLRASTVAINSAGARMEVDGASFTATGTTTITGAANTALVVNSGSASLATVTFTNASDGRFVINGGTVEVGAVTIPRSSDTRINYETGFVVTGGSTTVGTISLGTGNSNAFMSMEGGELTATGVVTVGNQVTGGRGGAIRVTGGVFNSTDTARGLVLAKTNGANANNVSAANFLGGVSTIEKITLGFDNTVTAGSGTVTLDGGDLYLGTGGIVKNGTAGMTTAINLTSGLLGAKGNWSTSLPITLTSGGNVTVKAASAEDAPFGITLSGVVSGSGSLIKTGGGSLNLTSANTFTGSAVINAGTLNVNGTLAAPGAVSVNAGGTLAGTGTIDKAVTLNSGGTISPAGLATGTLTAASLTWNGGGAMAMDLGAASDRLTLTGALTKGGAGTYRLIFNGTPAIGTVHTVASFGSTTFTAADFSYSGLSGVGGAFAISGNTLTFTVTELPDAAFTTWAEGLPAGQRGALDDPDGDGIANLLEFVLGTDAGAANASPESNGVATADGDEYPTYTYTRRIARGGAEVVVQVSASLDFSNLLGAVELSATPTGDGLETVVVRSAVPLSVQPRQFFRLSATLP